MPHINMSGEELKRRLTLGIDKILGLGWPMSKMLEEEDRRILRGLRNYALDMDDQVVGQILARVNKEPIRDDNSEEASGE